MKIPGFIAAIGRRLAQRAEPAQQANQLAHGLAQSPVKRVVARAQGNSQPWSSQPPTSFPAASAPLAGPRRVVRGRARVKPLKKWQESRWFCRAGLLPGGIPGAEYSGFYRTPRGRKYQGVIVETEHEVKPYIFEPPRDDIEQYAGHGACFRDSNSGWYWVHLLNRPRSVDEAILNIEALLEEVERKAGWPRVVAQPLLRVRARSGGLQ